jgi:periplasmic copper chaperone A
MKRITLLAPLMLTALAACGQEPQLRVSDGWVRLSPLPDRPSAAYFTIHGGPTPAQLISVRSSVAIRTEMHDMAMNGNVMQMRPITGNLPIPAEGTVDFAPGGKHIMLFNMNPGIKPGSRVPFLFTFADGTRIEYNARAQAAGDPPPEK